MINLKRRRRCFLILQSTLPHIHQPGCTTMVIAIDSIELLIYVRKTHDTQVAIYWWMNRAERAGQLERHHDDKREISTGIIDARNKIICMHILANQVLGLVMIYDLSMAQQPLPSFYILSRLCRSFEWFQVRRVFGCSFGNVQTVNGATPAACLFLAINVRWVLFSEI